MQGLDSQLPMTPRFITHFKTELLQTELSKLPTDLHSLWRPSQSANASLHTRITCLQTKQIHSKSRFQAHPRNTENKPEQAAASLCEWRPATYATVVDLLYVYDFNISVHKWPFLNMWEKRAFCQLKLALQRGVSRKVWMVQWGLVMCEAGCLAQFWPSK